MIYRENTKWLKIARRVHYLPTPSINNQRSCPGSQAEGASEWLEAHENQNIFSSGESGVKFIRSPLKLHWVQRGLPLNPRSKLTPPVIGYPESYLHFFYSLWSLHYVLTICLLHEDSNRQVPVCLTQLIHWFKRYLQSNKLGTQVTAENKTKLSSCTSYPSRGKSTINKQVGFP